jgi:hypothetical protein
MVLVALTAFNIIRIIVLIHAYTSCWRVVELIGMFLGTNAFVEREN